MALKPRERILAGIVGATAFIIFNYFLIGPGLDKWRELQTQKIQIQSEIAEAKALIAREGQWRTEANQLLQRLRQAGDSQSAGDIIGRVEGLSGQFGVSFTQRTPSEPQERQRYVEKSAQFTFNTQWPGLIHFLYALGKQPEVYRVIALRLRAGQKDPNDLSGDMAVLTYYLRPGQDIAATAPRNSIDNPPPAAEDMGTAK